MLRLPRHGPGIVGKDNVGQTRAWLTMIQTRRVGVKRTGRSFFLATTAPSLSVEIIPIDKKISQQYYDVSVLRCFCKSSRVFFEKDRCDARRRPEKNFAHCLYTPVLRRKVYSSTFDACRSGRVNSVGAIYTHRVKYEYNLCDRLSQMNTYIIFRDDGSRPTLFPGLLYPLHGLCRCPDATASEDRS